MAELADFDLNTPHVVIVKQFRRRRTVDQNAKLHAMISDIANHCGYSLDEMKEIVKFKFLGEKSVNIGGETLRKLKGTSDLNVNECIDFVDQLYAWGNSLGVNWSD